MKTNKRCGYLTLLISTGFLAGIPAGCGNARKAEAEDAAHAPTAPVVKIARRSLSNTLEIASEFEPLQEIEVYAKVSGYIKTLYVDWGTHVKKGQILAELEIPELQQQLQQDEAGARRSDQDLSRAREELNRAQSAYTVAHLTYTRLAEVQKSRPELMAQEEVGKDQAMFAYARITAPFDGVVTKIYAYTGALLPAGTSSNKGDLALCQLSQNDILRLVIPVPERAVADVHVGDTVDIEVSQAKNSFTGKVIRFSDQIDTQTRTMHTEVQVPNPNYLLVPGMYASVKIPLRSALNVLSIPVQAVESTGNSSGAVLLVNASNRVERRDVKLGIQTATEAEVLSGLNENDTVIFGEQNQFKVGELVSPQIVTAPGMN
ncbi:MAG: efflux RND transporter periplasmic adaptor subunit [Candidatus Acidiferrales bacterium]